MKNQEKQKKKKKGKGEAEENKTGQAKGGRMGGWMCGWRVAAARDECMYVRMDGCVDV